MALETTPDLNYYTTSPQPLAHDRSGLDQAGTEMYDSFGQHETHGGVGGLSDDTRAITTNGYDVSPTQPQGDSPDEFYKSFGQQSSNSSSATIRNEISNLSATRQQLSHANRSASSTTAQKYPPLQSRSQPSKPSHRSASAPVIERVQPRVGRSAAVQDRIMMFNQKAGQASSIPRGTSKNGSPRIPDLSSPASGTSSRKNFTPGQATREPFSSRVKSPQPPRTTQRPRFTVEDQHSNNTLASAARPAKQTRSRSNAPEDTPWAGRSTALSPPSSRPPLFGEIVISESGSQIPYGISEPRGRTRRSVDSTISDYRRNNAAKQGNSPGSPTEDWYRVADEQSRESDSPDFPGKHTRSMSDSYSSSIQPQPLFGAVQESKPQMKSRLPIMSKPTASSPVGSGPSNGRSSSAMEKRIASNSHYQTTTGRSYSPAGLDGYRGRGTRGQPRNASKPPANIRAMITPLSPPMKSPPLRSSKIRLPVSSASTASSRNKMTEKAGPGARSRTASRAESREGMRSVVRPDFAARRARIQEGMNKRAEEIKEKEQQAQEAQERAEMEEAAARMQDNVNGDGEDVREEAVGIEHKVSTAQQPYIEQEESPVLPPTEHTPFHRRSPALGMPGSFPISQRVSADTPVSAISTNSVDTLFDNELQTEPPTQQDTHHTEVTRPSVDSFEYPAHHTLAHKGEVVNFAQLLAEATEDLGGDADRSYRYSDDDSPVYPPSQPRSWDILNSKKSIEMPYVPALRDGMSTRKKSSASLESHSYNGESAHSPAPAHSAAYPQEQLRQPDRSQRSRPSSQSPGPSLKLHNPTSPPRSSNSQLPKLLTSANLLEPYNHQDDVFSAVTNIDEECSASTEESPRMSVEKLIPPSPSNIHSQDGTYDQKQPPPSTTRMESFKADNGLEGNVLKAQVNDVVPDAPPPPPKERTYDPAPAVPPKSDGYTPLTPRPHGDHQEGAKSYASSNDMSFRARSQHAKSFERASNSSGSASANPSIHSADNSSIGFGRGNGSSPNLWDHDVSLQLRPYPPVNSNTRRESADTGPYRPSTSTARSSAFLSNGSDEADTPVSSNEQPEIELPHQECPIGVGEFTAILQRKNHLIELVDTEAAFNKDMNVLIEIYQGTAIAVPDLKPIDIRIIFRNATQITDMSRNFLADLKETVMPVYAHRSARAKARTGEGQHIGTETATMMYPTLPTHEIIEAKQNDEKTAVGQVFLKHIPIMLKAFTRFINGSKAATVRIQELTAQHPSIKVWLEECNDAASDLSAAWDLGSMLVKPMQRMTKYPMMIMDLLKQTPKDDERRGIVGHPDRKALDEAYAQMQDVVKKVNEDTARVELVRSALSEHQKKKELAASGNIVKMFRRDKTEIASLDRASEDPKYLFCVDRYHSEFARIEIIIRDIQGYIDKVDKQTSDFLRLLSAIELVMRATASPFPELESKWARFNLSMRDMGTIGLEQHLKVVENLFLKPFKDLSESYGDVQPTIGLRNKRRPRHLEYDKLLHKWGQDEKIAHAKMEDKLVKHAKEYTALNDTLKMELPRLSELNEKLKHICLGGFVGAQAHWYSLWNEKLRTVLDPRDLPYMTMEDIINKFTRDSEDPHNHALTMKLCNGQLLAEAKAGAASLSRNSESTVREEDGSLKSKSRTSTIGDRQRGYSVNSDYPPASFLSPSLKPAQSEHSPSYSTANSSGWSLAQSGKRDTGSASHHGGDGAGSSDGPRTLHSSRAPTESRRTSTDSRQPRPSGESFTMQPTVTTGARSPIVTGMSSAIPSAITSAAPSSSTSVNPGGWVDGLPPQEPAFSDVFKSALPWEDKEQLNAIDIQGTRLQNEDGRGENGPKTLYVVASLCAFHIEGTKTEANYPYLTYQEGEIFDVVAEKGELWLAKNQDDVSGRLGWIWNQHFARISGAD